MENRNKLENIRDVFSIFHDGIILNWNGNEELLQLIIDCEYLAQKIDKSFTSFVIELKNIEKIEFNPWMNPINLPQKTFIKIEDIFQTGLEILSADIENEMVKITCNQHNLNYEYCGGTLLLNCKSLKIFDENKNELTIDEINKICEEYWNETKLKIENSLIEKRTL
ncbi:hypothetical protein J3S90_15510 [Flavobacterium sp. P4023]|uniref:Immunity protein 50 n=1 Tax=Flavobacterium flabelliforme TaxID=2816119 RepID=A0ABS5CX66_9FLAO|nr:hypothetical protein [Flavobacterium flabelliforme]MBP4143212.1 hypothetical protein [Flavobacterium flabelliforme]